METNRRKKQTQSALTHNDVSQKDNQCLNFNHVERIAIFTVIHSSIFHVENESWIRNPVQYTCQVQSHLVAFSLLLLLLLRCLRYVYSFFLWIFAIYAVVSCQWHITQLDNIRNNSVYKCVLLDKKMFVWFSQIWKNNMIGISSYEIHNEVYIFRGGFIEFHKMKIACDAIKLWHIS